MRNNKEYELCKAIATYLKLQYPNIYYRFDLSGLNLSIAQAGMNKAIQKNRGYPDLFICKPNHGFHGLFIELKANGTKIVKKNGEYASEHIREQWATLKILAREGYLTTFAIGFDDVKRILDSYLGIEEKEITNQLDIFSYA